MEKELSPAQKQALLREQFQKKIKFLLSKKGLHQHEVRDLVHALFKDWLGLNFEFTYEEAKSALDAVYLPEDVRSRVGALLEDMNLAEFYQDHEQSEDQLQDAVKTIDALLPLLLGTPTKEKDVIGRIFSTLRLPTFKRKPAQPGASLPPASASAAPPVPLAPQSQKPADGSDIPLPSQMIAGEQMLKDLRKQAEDRMKPSAPGPAPAPEEKTLVPQDLFSEPAAGPAELPPIGSAPGTGAWDSPSREQYPPAPAAAQPGPIPAWDDHALIVEDDSQPHQRIYERLERLYDALSRSEIEDAKGIYNDLLSYYHPLPIDDKRKYYDVLYQVYLKLATN